jgi:hypothetical protein
MKSEVQKGNVERRDELLACISDSDARIKKRRSTQDEQHAILAHELQSGTVFDGGTLWHLL